MKYRLEVSVMNWFINTDLAWYVVGCCLMYGKHYYDRSLIMIPA